MILSKYKLLLLLFFFLVVQSTNLLAQNNSANSYNIHNLHLIDSSGVYRSAQPSRKQLKALTNDSFTIINLRRKPTDSHRMKSIIGSRLVFLPMKAKTLTEEDLFKALSVIKESPQPVLFHCYAGADRTGAVAAMYHIIFQNWSKEKALDDMQNGGYHFHKKHDNLPKLIMQIDTEAFRKRLFQNPGKD